jgi:hypothetical protein
VETGTADIELITSMTAVDHFASIAESMLMSETHGRVISAAAKSALWAVGFRQRGRSRLWLLDHGYWLNLVEFTPSRWSKSVSLMNGAHWLWTGTGSMSFNEAVPSSCHAEFRTEDQFAEAVNEIAKMASRNALEIEARFQSFSAIAAFVVERARTSPNRMGASWWGYEAGIATGLNGNFGEARDFLRGVSDERVISRAQALLPLLDNPEAFMREVNRLVSLQRATLKLSALEAPCF